MKALCLVVAFVALSAVTACSQDGSQAASLQVLDEEVPALRNGVSIEEVEDQLGAPRNRAELEEGEISLYYGPWQLFFEPELISRVRYYKAGYWPPGRPVAKLDRDVHKLKLKSSLAEVERQLGKPESWQIDVPERGKIFGTDRADGS